MEREIGMMELVQLRRSVRSPRFLTLAVLAFLVTSPGGRALAARRSRAQNKMPSVRAPLNSPTALSPRPKSLFPPHRQSTFTAKEERQKAKEIIGTVGELRKADAALSGFLKNHPDDSAFFGCK